MRALALARSEGWSAAHPLVDSLVLAVPAVPRDALGPKGELRGGLNEAGGVEIYYNSQDHFVLGLAYPIAARRTAHALGYLGPLSRTLDDLSHVVADDVGPLLGPTHAAQSAVAAIWPSHLRRVVE